MISEASLYPLEISPRPLGITHSPLLPAITSGID
jgi:hypothetical protein